MARINYDNLHLYIVFHRQLMGHCRSHTQITELSVTIRYVVVDCVTHASRTVVLFNCKYSWWVLIRFLNFSLYIVIIIVKCFYLLRSYTKDVTEAFYPRWSTCRFLRVFVVACCCLQPVVACYCLLLAAAVHCCLLLPVSSRYQLTLPFVSYIRKIHGNASAMTVYSNDKSWLAWYSYVIPHIN